MQARSLFLAAALAFVGANARADSRTGDEAPSTHVRTAALELHAPAARMKVAPAAKAHKAAKPVKHSRPERSFEEDIQQLG